MNQAMKRILSFAFVLILVVGLAAPAFAAGKVTTADGQITVGISRPDSYGSGGMVYLYLAYGKKTFNLDCKKIAVSKGTSGAEPSEFVKNSFSAGEKLQYRSGSSWKNRNTGKNTSMYMLMLHVKQPGTAKVVYYVGKTKHTVKLTIKKFLNPVKTLTLTGVNGGKNFPVKRDRGQGSLPLNADVKTARLKVVPAKNWKVLEVEMYDSNTGAERVIGFTPNNGIPAPANAMASCTVNWGRLVKGHDYMINLAFINIRTKAIQSISYQISTGS